jgi:hypothetical protein
MEREQVRSLVVACALAAAVLGSAGCGDSGGGGEDADVVTGDGADADADADAGDGTGDGADADAPPTGLEGLVGEWVVERNSEGVVAWGSATASTGMYAGYVTFSFRMDNGSEPLLRAQLLDERTLSGAAVLSPGVPFPSVPNWEGTLSGDGDTITSTLTGGGAITLRRAVRTEVPAVVGLTGLWTRADDGTPVVVACDGAKLLISVVDAAGNWPPSEWYGAEIVAGAQDIVATADTRVLLFEGSTRMHLQIDVFGDVHGAVLEREATQSELNGLWIGGSRRSSGRLIAHSLALLVADGDTLYVHERADGESSELLHTRHATRDGTGWFDEADGWRAHFAADGSRLIGEIEGYDGWFVSFDRTVAPPDGYLDLEASSYSIDWTAGSGWDDPVPVFGSAVLTQEGDRLSITDTWEDGRTYRVDATWTGRWYEGVWWDASAPGETSFWQGELLAHGQYLHGTWALGEYSFALLPLGSQDTMGELPPGGVAVVLDPFEDVLAMYRGTGGELAGTILRSQDRLTGFTYSTAAGQILHEVDERLRPTRISGQGETVTFVWADDSSSFEVTVDDGSEVVTQTVVMDLSDAGLLAAVAALETRTGTDQSALRDWLAANPGAVGRVLRGEERLAGLGQAPLSSTWSKDLPPHPWYGEVLFEGILAGAVVAGAGMYAIVAIDSVAMLSTAAMAGAVAATLAGAVLGAWAFWNLVHWILGIPCDPCNILCFVYCDWS